MRWFSLAAMLAIAGCQSAPVQQDVVGELNARLISLSDGSVALCLYREGQAICAPVAILATPVPCIETDDALDCRQGLEL